MSEGHIFIDASAEVHKGKEEVNWEEYMKIFPDYKIHIQNLIEKENMIILIGRSEGNFSENGEKLFSKNGNVPSSEDYQGSAIWPAKVENGLIKEWRVYFDNKKNRSLLKID
ncbi:MAG: nuclear transport factor 2 family protein [Promethearchaeota archaeon]|nr:MAG: nuclear transport factor 2 family protein [Candidatus Lokiarchaeota archaeon]